MLFVHAVRQCGALHALVQPRCVLLCGGRDESFFRAICRCCNQRGGLDMPAWWRDHVCISLRVFLGLSGAVSLDYRLPARPVRSRGPSVMSCVHKQPRALPDRHLHNLVLPIRPDFASRSPSVGPVSAGEPPGEGVNATDPSRRTYGTHVLIIS